MTTLSRSTSKLPSPSLQRDGGGDSFSAAAVSYRYYLRGVCVFELDTNVCFRLAPLNLTLDFPPSFMMLIDVQGFGEEEVGEGILFV